jgi:glycosyltransferase involved in cell wall biosynthesis
MNNLPFISVIIPVYNQEKYLARCIDSVINQTYKNLEIILVDDGSLDSSSSICDDYALKDCRVRVRHQMNGGLSVARNVGIAMATSEYIGFIDSDDWVAHDMYDYCMNLMDISNADVVQVNYCTVSNEETVIQSQKEKKEILKNEEILQYYMITTTITGSYSVCRCLFKKSLLSNIKFRTGKINEDIDFKYKVLANCSIMVVSNLIKYFYFQSGNSISSGALKYKDFELYEAAEELYKLTASNNSAIVRKLGEVKKARTAFSLLCKIAFYGISDKLINKQKIVKQLTDEHRNNLRILINSPISFSRKILAVLFAIDFRVTEMLVHIAKRF